MANTIALAKRYEPILDEIYLQDAKTNILQGSNNQVKASLTNVNEVLIAKRTVGGLGDFSRAGSETMGPAGGYSMTPTTLEWESVKYDKERSGVIAIDRLNADESLDQASANILGQFIRESVIPETDAARMAAISSVAIAEGNYSNTAITTGEEAIKALRAAINNLDGNEVSGDLALFIRPEYIGLIDDLNSFASKAVMQKFSDIVEMPHKRMYSKIDLLSGEGGLGYKKAADAVDLAFVIVDKNAVICDMRQYLKMIGPDASPLNDAYNYFYRNYNLYGYILENKRNGVYTHIISE